MTRFGSRGTWRWLFPPIGDFLLLHAALATTFCLRQPDLLTLRTEEIFLPLLAAWLLAFYFMGLYELRLARDFVTLVRNLAASAGVCLFLGTTYFYTVAAHSGLKPKTHLFLAVVISHALILLWRRLWLWLLKFDLLDQRFVFLGEPAQLQEIEKGMPAHRQETGLSVVPGFWACVDLVVADAAWVDRNWAEARGVFLAAIARGVPVVTLEDFYESIFGKVSPAYAGNPSWALEFALPKSARAYWALKRLIDIVGATLLLLALAPFLGLVALIVALFDGGPVLFSQTRAGLLGQTFRLWKFRTMTHGAEAKGPFTSAKSNDARITRLGAVLRRLRIDELPQLWNVLIGDMSLVGPRPEWVREVEVLEKVIPSYHLRHLVKPGITGWAQVRFRATNSVDDSIEKIHYDLYYVKFLSFGLDLSIILKTIKRVFVSDTRVEAVPAPVIPASSASRWVHDLTVVFGRS